MGLWNSIKGWLYKPFQEPLDPGNWALLLILGATVAYMWTRVLENVLEE